MGNCSKRQMICCLKLGTTNMSTTHSHAICYKQQVWGLCGGATCLPEYLSYSSLQSLRSNLLHKFLEPCSRTRDGRKLRKPYHVESTESSGVLIISSTAESFFKSMWHAAQTLRFCIDSTGADLPVVQLDEGVLGQVCASAGINGTGRVDHVMLELPY